MPLQNRVTPFGEIVALVGRGLVMGNRGVLHDDERRIVRYSQVRRWLACQIEFRGRHRVVMRPHSYTELFFLDEDSVRRWPPAVRRMQARGLSTLLYAVGALPRQAGER